MSVTSALRDGKTPARYVLAVSTTWPPMAAGSGRAFKELVSGLDNLIVLAPRTSSVPKGDSLTVHRVLRFAGRSGGPFKIYSLLQHAEAALAPVSWALVQRSRPSTVICSVALSAGLGGWLLNRLAGVPYVVYAQGEEIAAPLKQQPLWGWRFRLTRAVLSRAELIVCISRFTLNLVRERYGVEARRLHLFPPAVHDESAPRSDVAEARRRFAADGQLLLMVGRLAQRRKGFDRAIEALPAILHHYPRARLVIAGPGSAHDLRALAGAHGVADAVIFTGEIERSALLSLYAACDLFLLPARTMDDGDTEGFGVVFLEAGLMGKPVIAGRTGGVEDAVVDGTTGLVVDGNRADQISAAVLRLLGDPVLAKELGAQGRRRVLTEFVPAVQQEAFRLLIDESVSRIGETRV